MLFHSKPAPCSSPDLKRIKGLPYRDIPGSIDTQALVRIMTDRYSLGEVNCNCDRCITELRPVQAWALYEIAIEGGLFGPIGVGHGKTFLDILAPLALDSKLAVLFVPAPLRTQLITEYERVAQHFRVPSLVVHGEEYTSIKPGGVTLHVMSYSSLSGEKATTFLEQLKPDAILCDEFHKIRNPDSARAIRIMRYMSANPKTKFAGWSGSVTDKSIKDYAHLCAMSLGLRSPLPLDPEVVESWAHALDPSDDPAPPGALSILCGPKENVRQGFNNRLVHTLGVVTTSQPAIDAELILKQKTLEVPKVISDALRALRESWKRPDGEELIDALSMARCARELAAGFYYYWYFPEILEDGEWVKQKTSTIFSWLEARKDWRAELRKKLKFPAPHMDSPLLLTKAARRSWGDDTNENNLPVWRATHWPRWRDIRDKVQVDTLTHRVDDYLIRNAAEWGHKYKGVIWYESRAVGHWLEEISGLPLYAGGPNAGTEIANADGSTSIIASLRSHGTGRDGLQYLFSNQLWLQPPSSAAQWEQGLGRLHRIGQPKDTVRGEVYTHTDELLAAFECAKGRAEYIEDTIGSKQKLIS